MVSEHVIMYIFNLILIKEDESFKECLNQKKFNLDVISLDLISFKFDNCSIGNVYFMSYIRTDWNSAKPIVCIKDSLSSAMGSCINWQ